MRAGAAPGDVLARLGGDEFAVLTDGSPMQAYALASRLVTGLAEAYQLPGTTVHLTASVGLTDVTADGTVDDTLRRAELALRRAKQSGRGRVEWYDEDMERAIAHRMTLETATRLVYLGAENIGDWYQCVATPALQTAGCNADGGYLNLVAVDDDNGDLTDGTPHVEAIYNALARHQIACAPPPVGVGPPVTNSGCAGAPATAPPGFSVTPLVQSAHLSWSAVAGASEYWIFRTEGVRGCDFGKVKIAETTSTNFTDTGLLDGFQYLYAVLAVGSHDSCLGPMTACVAATPLPPASPPAEATFAFREVASPFTILTGDGDVYLDNCELASFSFELENAGNVNIEDVEVTITSPSHPGTEILLPIAK